MLVSLVDTPEEFRAELLKLLEWKIACEQRNVMRNHTKRDNLKSVAREAALTEFARDLASIVIEPKKGNRDG